MQPWYSFFFKNYFLLLPDNIRTDMIKIISFPFSILAYVWFLFFICLYHPIQWLCFNLFGYQAHKKSVDVMNFFLIRTLYFTFSTYKVENKHLVPKDKPVIFAANHQGIFDIIGLAWLLREFHPKFVSKIELGKGIPSVYIWTTLATSSAIQYGIKLMWWGQTTCTSQIWAEYYT